jgi:hypothetical protein
MPGFALALALIGVTLNIEITYKINVFHVTDVTVDALG